MIKNADEAEAELLMRELEELAKKSHTLTINEANQIVNDTGRIIGYLLNCNHFSPFHMPNSLLPREKSIVLEAFAVCFKHSIPDSQDRHSLYTGYSIIKKDFVSDEQALEWVKK